MLSSSVYYIEKSENKCIISTNSGDFYIKTSLNKMLDKLPKSYKRCHKSFIANINNVKVIDNKNKLLIFENDINCPISDTFYFKTT